MTDGRRALAQVGPWTVGVPDAVPGDLADVELREHRNGAYRGHMVTLIRPSARRVAPLCPHFERCGGCQWQRLDGTVHAEYKGALVRRALAAIDLGALPMHVVPAAAAWAYRTAGTYVPAVDDRGPALGLHAAAGTLPVPIHTCLVQSPPLAAAFEEMRHAWRALASRWEDSGTRGLPCRQIRIRIGDASRDVAVGLIYDGRLTPSARDAIVDVISTRVAGVVEITGKPARSLPRTSGSMSGLRWGRSGVVEAILDRWYHVPVFAPFPVTGRAAAGAITSVIEALALDDRTALLETDAGIGAYTLPAAAKARLVVGRTTAEHLDTARHNAVWNDASNAVFVDRAAETLARILRSHGPIRRALVRVTQDAVPFETLHRGGVGRLVLLVSSPARLAEVLGAAAAGGFEPRAVTVIDTHPQTSRAEIHAVLDACRGAWPGARLPDDRDEIAPAP
ncbi:MAG TPA: hypothetical protein VGX75_14080 [bacterium]|nr:hypothetical protein [bacterium]